MNTPQTVKRATLKDPQGIKADFLLQRHGKGDYRWSGVDTTAYLSEEDAIRGMRATVEGKPEFVGWDLTIMGIEPPAALRAAARLVDKTFHEGWWKAVDKTLVEAQQVIEEETNSAALVDAVETLIAYIFLNRSKFAKALFPTTPAGEPRDLVCDGLLLTVIEALEKTTLQDHENLKKKLREPVSQILSARALPKETRQ